MKDQLDLLVCLRHAELLANLKGFTATADAVANVLAEMPLYDQKGSLEVSFLENELKR